MRVPSRAAPNRSVSRLSDFVRRPLTAWIGLRAAIIIVPLLIPACGTQQSLQAEVDCSRERCDSYSLESIDSCLDDVRQCLFFQTPLGTSIDVGQEELEICLYAAAEGDDFCQQACEITEQDDYCNELLRSARDFSGPAPQCLDVVQDCMALCIQERPQTAPPPIAEYQAGDIYELPYARSWSGLSEHSCERYAREVTDCGGTNPRDCQGMCEAALATWQDEVTPELTARCQIYCSEADSEQAR